MRQGPAVTRRRVLWIATIGLIVASAIVTFQLPRDSFTPHSEEERSVVESFRSTARSIALRSLSPRSIKEWRNEKILEVKVGTNGVAHVKTQTKERAGRVFRLIRADDGWRVTDIGSWM